MRYTTQFAFAPVYRPKQARMRDVEKQRQEATRVQEQGSHGVREGVFVRATSKDIRGQTDCGFAGRDR